LETFLRFFGLLGVKIAESEKVPKLRVLIVLKAEGLKDRQSRGIVFELDHQLSNRISHGEDRKVLGLCKAHVMVIMM